MKSFSDTKTQEGGLSFNTHVIVKLGNWKTENVRNIPTPHDAGKLVFAFITFRSNNCNVLLALLPL